MRQPAKENRGRVPKAKAPAKRKSGRPRKPELQVENHDAAVEEARIALGRRVRALRTERGISGRALAMRIGVTSGFISQLELGTVSPSVASLVKLSAVLDVQVGDLFGDPRPPGRVLRKSERVPYVLPGSIFVEERLCSDPRLEVVHTTIAPGGASGPELFGRHAELEFAVVLKGKIVLELGAERYELSTADAITFPGRVPHGTSNPSRRASAELLWASVPALP